MRPPQTVYYNSMICVVYTTRTAGCSSGGVGDVVKVCRLGSSISKGAHDILLCGLACVHLPGNGFHGGMPNATEMEQRSRVSGVDTSLCFQNVSWNSTAVVYHLLRFFPFHALVYARQSTIFRGGNLPHFLCVPRYCCYWGWPGTCVLITGYSCRILSAPS